MSAIYRCLLKLYPRLDRYNFADEMLNVFVEAEGETRDKGVFERATFYLREFFGLASGALREQLHDVAFCERRALKTGGIMMRPTRCRFPRSAIFMMTFVFVIVLGMIAKIQGVSHFYGSLVVGELSPKTWQWPSYYGLISGIAVCFLLAWVTGVAVWAVAYAMRRTPAQQLGDFDAGTQARH